MTDADVIIIVIINGPWAVMIHGVPVKTYNALQNHIIVLLFTTRKYIYPNIIEYILCRQC